MQVKLLNSVPISSLVGETGAARPPAEDSFKDTLEDVRETSERGEESEPAEEKPVEETGESNEPVTQERASTEPVVVEEALPGEILFAPVQAQTDTTANVVTAEVGMNTSTSSVTPVVEVQAGTDQPTTTENTTLNTTPTQTTVDAVVEDAPQIQKQAVVDVKGQEKQVAEQATVQVATEARVRPVSDQVVESAMPQTAEGESTTTMGTQNTQTGTGASPGERDHSFFMLGKDAVASAAAKPTATNPAVPVVEGIEAMAEPMAQAVTEARVAPSAPQEQISSTSNTSPTTATAVDGTSQMERIENMTRSTPVLRAEAGDEAGLTRRIYRLVRRALRNGDSEIKIRLDPPNLGRVDVQVRLKGDKVDVVFQVDDEQVRSAVVKSLEDLERALSDHGYHTDEVNVDLRDASRGSEHETGQGNQSGTDGDTDTGTDSMEHEVQLDHLGTAMDLRG